MKPKHRQEPSKSTSWLTADQSMNQVTEQILDTVDYPLISVMEKTAVSGYIPPGMFDQDIVYDCIITVFLVESDKPERPVARSRPTR